MTRLPDRAPRVLDELRDTLSRIDRAEVEEVVAAVARARRIHVIGVGREGLMARAFAMRLMHAGLSVHWVWDDTTPAIGDGDLFIAVSGSGQIGHIDYVARRAHESGAELCVITANPGGETARRANVTLAIPGAAYGASEDVVRSLQPMGSLFEQALLVTLDLVMLDVVDALGTEADRLADRHRNVE